MRQWPIWGAEEGHDEVGTFVLSRALSVIVVTGAMGYVFGGLIGGISTGASAHDGWRPVHRRGRAPGPLQSRRRAGQPR
jgi:hypothetical protein